MPKNICLTNFLGVKNGSSAGIKNILSDFFGYGIPNNYILRLKFDSAWNDSHTRGVGYTTWFASSSFFQNIRL